jgi:hypothetical protein
VGFELTTLVVIGTDCIGSCKSNYHTITTMTVPFIPLRILYLFIINVNINFRIGHDNSGVFGAAWFLDKVIIDAPSLGCSWTFPCSKWLADNKDDCQLERELFPQDLETVEYNPCKSSRRTIQSDYSPHLFFSTISLLHRFIGQSSP